jgi:hypothetical protein
VLSGIGLLPLPPAEAGSDLKVRSKPNRPLPSFSLPRAPLPLAAAAVTIRNVKVLRAERCPLAAAVVCAELELFMGVGRARESRGDDSIGLSALLPPRHTRRPLKLRASIPFPPCTHSGAIQESGGGRMHERASQSAASELALPTRRKDATKTGWRRVERNSNRDQKSISLAMKTRADLCDRLRPYTNTPKRAEGW